MAKPASDWRMTGVIEVNLIKERYVVNEKGDRLSVILDVED